jgi:N-acyl-phosphatidylethanolamine-hydrolysing phospholipase D
MSRPSHHREGGGFKNPWPGASAPRFQAVMKWLWWDRLVHRLPAQPSPSVFRTVPPAFDVPRASPGVLTVTWLGHSSTLIQAAGLNLLTDPIWSRRASPVPFAGPVRWGRPPVPLDQLPPVDVVLISHNHYDHFDSATVRWIAARYPAAQWFAPLGLTPLLTRMGAVNVRELDWWGAARHGELDLTCVPAQHFSARGMRDRNATLWCGWAVAVAGRRLYFAADTGYHPDFQIIGERLGPFDLTMLPIGAYNPASVMRPVHLDPEEAVRAFQEIQRGAPGVMMGIHWGTYQLTDEPMDEPPRRARDAWAAAGLGAESLWIPLHGETRRF